MSFLATHLIGFGAKRAAAASEQTVTWNPSDKDADVTLSESDRLAGFGGVGSVRATLSRSTGKYYFEIVCPVFAGNARIGFCDSGYSLATYPGNAANSVGCYTTGNAASGWTKATAGSTSWAAGDVIGFAIDLGAGYAWQAVNNTWAASGNPAAGTTPWITGIASAVYPLTGSAGSTSTTARIYASTSELTYSPPAGFSVWAAA